MEESNKNETDQTDPNKLFSDSSNATALEKDKLTTNANTSPMADESATLADMSEEEYDYSLSE